MSESIEPGIIRLERSRSALFEYLRANDRPATRANDGVSGYAEAVGGADLSGVASAIFQGWWQQHPVRVGLNAAWGLIEGEVRRHPLRAVAIAAAGTAMIAWLRPWRAVAFSSLVHRVAPLANFGGLAAAMLSAAVAAQFRDAAPPPANSGETDSSR